MKRLVAFLTCAAAAVVSLLVLSPPSHGQGQSGPNGDITAVRTGSSSGLEGGAERGVADLSMRTDCGDGSGVAWSASGSAWECAALGAGDIEGVTAGSGLGGGGTSGTVTLDVNVGTGLDIVLDAIALNITGASCSAGQFVSVISTTGDGTCTAEVGDISGVTANSPLSGGGTSGAVTVGMANGDRGDITTTTGTQTGDTWTIDNSTVTSAKLNITTTSCSAGQHVSAISAGGVGTCTASGGLSGLTSGVVPRATSSTTIGDGQIKDDGTNPVSIGPGADSFSEANARAGVQGNGTSSFAVRDATNNIEVALRAQSGATRAFSVHDVPFILGRGGTDVLNITTTAAQFASTGRLLWTSGTITGTVDTGLARNAAGVVEVNNGTAGTLADIIVANLTTTGNSLQGNADTDTNTSRGVLGFTGADVTVSSGNCTVAGEAQSFTITLSGDISTGAPCVVALNRTITGNRCVGSPSNAAAAGNAASLGYSVSQSTTTATLAPGSSTMNSGTWNVQCLGDFD